MKYLSDASAQLLQEGVNHIQEGLELFKAVTFDPAPSSAPVTPPAAINESSELPTQSVGGAAKRAIPWGKQAAALHPDFIDGLLWIESKIELSPEILLPCMKFESDLNPAARNPASTASGLIQFMSFTAKNLGTTIEAIRKMDAMAQLSYVYKYFAAMRKDWSDLNTADVYMAILWPKAIGKPLDYKMWQTGTDEYKVNKGLDRNKDGMITKAEAASRVLELEKQGYEDSNVLYI